MPATHTYELGLQWTGNTGTGTSSYRAYERTHELSAPGKPTLAGSADRPFRGEADRWNPEELLVASLSALPPAQLPAPSRGGRRGGDRLHRRAAGRDGMDGQGGGHFAEVLLRPTVVVAEPGMIEVAEGLHEAAHQKCFIASSVNFPVRHAATVIAAGTSGTPTEA